MRLVTYEAGNGPRAGILIGEEIVDAEAAGAPSASTREILASLDSTGLAALGSAAEAVDDRTAREEVRLLAPVPDPQKIICLGLNYRDHAAEANKEIPENPMWFAKFANSLIGDRDEIVLPVVHGEHVDYEAELAVVIGREAHRVSEAEAPDYVAGAMPFNDVSARTLQLENPLWTSGKALDTFAPCGPALVTLDEAGDLQALGLRTYLDGEVVQEGNTSDMIFSVAETVAWLSRTMTLMPGDIIATGTPAGVGGVQGIFLRDGSTVQVEVDGLGTVTNPIRATS
jgi:2-keto-4-pentenoate hydratase/2-oxohepta-3-ene-1,7-dioic acid hydratase in catechol pathway